MSVNDIQQMGSSIHKLTGDLAEFWFIKGSPNYQIVFRFVDGDVLDVDYLDYHQGGTAMKRALPPVHPGEILREDYINERGLSISEVANGLCLPRPNLSKILNGKGGISPEMAVKVSEAFGNSTQFWINLKKNYDVWHAEQRVDRTNIRHFRQESQDIQAI